MRKLVLILTVFLFASISAYSQYNIDYGISAGASNYLGEFGGGSGPRRGFVADMKLNFSRWDVGAFFRYRLSSKFALKGALNYIRLTGDDAKTLNPARRGRNLNFKNDMFELLANTELYLYKINDVGRTGRYRTDFNLYLFGGIGLFYSNPKGQDANTGTWVALQPLQTEGVAYHKINFTIPAGLGFYYTLNRRYRLGMEVGWRTTFTDYIDDASTTYTTTYDGISNKTTQALINQINADNPDSPTLFVDNFAPGDKRGDPSHNDSYLTATINFSWTIRGRSKFYRAKHSWVLGRNKRRRRKSRAKF